MNTSNLVKSIIKSAFHATEDNVKIIEVKDFSSFELNSTDDANAIISLALVAMHTRQLSQKEIGLLADAAGTLRQATEPKVAEIKMPESSEEEHMIPKRIILNGPSTPREWIEYGYLTGSSNTISGMDGETGYIPYDMWKEERQFGGSKKTVMICHYQNDERPEEVTFA